MQRVKIGQLGVTHEHAGGKWTALNLLPEEFDVVGLVDDRATAKDPYFFNGMDYYKDARFITEDELFATEGLEAVTVEVPNTELVSMARKCADRGLAMHIDKPAGDSLEAFKLLLDVCAAKDIPLQMGYMFRGNPAMQFCRQIVEQGYLGDVFEIEADMHHSYGEPRYWDYLSTYKGGIIFNLGCHFFDYIVSFMGAPENVTSFLKTTKACNGQAVDYGVTVLQYDHALAIVKACDWAPSGRRRLFINGSNGMVELWPLERFDGVGLVVKMDLKEPAGPYKAGEQQIEFPPQTDRYVVQLTEFARIVRGEIENPYSYEHDYLVQRVNLAASGYFPWK